VSSQASSIATEEARRETVAAFRLEDLELVEGWAEDDPGVRARFNFPVTAASEAASTTLVYFEIEPGNRLSPHTHSAEEILLVLDGTARTVVEETSTILGKGGVAVIPAMALHNVENAGSGVLRAVGFFSAAGMVSTYEHLIMPMGTRVLVTPFPEQ
jgi:quercetin dioxygenase-like cupin family protein